MSTTTTIIVEGLRARRDLDINLTSERDRWSLALDQRVFGPRRLIVACADACGDVLGLAHTARIEPITLAFEACLDYFTALVPVAQAVAYSDEAVTAGPPPLGLARRWAEAGAIARRFGIELLDWIACDDDRYRSTRLALG